MEFISLKYFGSNGDLIYTITNKYDADSSLNSMTSLIVGEPTVTFESENSDEFNVKVTTYRTNSFTMEYREKNQ